MTNKVMILLFSCSLLVVFIGEYIWIFSNSTVKTQKIGQIIALIGAMFVIFFLIIQCLL